MPNITALAGAAQLLGVDGAGSLSVQVSGTWTGTLAFQASNDGGATWYSIPAWPVAGGASVTSTTANGNWTLPACFGPYIQVVSTAWTSGTAAVSMVGLRGEPTGLIAAGAGTVSLGSGTVATQVALATILAGENQVLQRFDVDMKPGDTDSILETLQNAVTATGVGTAINTKGFKGLTFRVVGTSGTWTGGLQGTIDDTNWYYLQLTSLADGTQLAGSSTQFNPSTATVDQVYVLATPNPALSQVRFNIATRSSGTITVTSRKAPR